MTYKRFLILIISLSLMHAAIGQAKNEKEERIKIAEFPKNAQNIIKILPDKCKRLKFYKETDGDKQSYEAKFKYKKRRYSLEFSTTGSIEDIEVITKFKHIEDTIVNSIKTYFKKSFTKYKVIKIQKQFVYSSDVSASDFVTNVLSQNTKAKTNFEIIAEVKTEKKRTIKEFTFNNTGAFLNSRLLNPSSYEHVLY